MTEVVMNTTYYTMMDEDKKMVLTDYQGRRMFMLMSELIQRNIEDMIVLGDQDSLYEESKHFTGIKIIIVPVATTMRIQV
ncbi:hypothetical protein EVB32_139 [Rhizobium phage RHph_TM39]|uniref:Uncharacterized protein n=2 Tax=Cuauhnahuacvirus TaxID=3044696 RepID=A0A7S5UYU2_9CAUD|nr:hypothetical protein PQC16_gp139 [Rhizobium phage RHph_TM30]YP_010671289.1 hypothetical protein PQC17_gp140 [Rhizobium phage RHph_Y65]QIG71610.1 hypothetical protein EVB94_139 [Rhizobium phage RHph_TM40]QIG71973.1 hypothetical protein EVB95_139 [Rhizobium phage RHph_TM2_3B]QIG72335.1 hypothetical protein EVB96_139 [Rhizobium phage RHph_TM3_3_6]QIG77127.1 hypothetical protein EVB32_139 [Rhizobium phage RHph_TM39]QIG77463.1 hypothetical protein EVB61_135 [Rhizobium phage RHph_TM21B]